MRFHDSEEYRSAQRMRVLHSGRRLTRDEGRQIFRGMVRAEARNGGLSPLRRRRLIAYAAALQLTPVEAGRIVADVCREHAVSADLRPPLIYRAVDTAARPHHWPIGVRIMLTVVAAFLLGQLVRAYWW